MMITVVAVIVILIMVMTIATVLTEIGFNSVHSYDNDDDCDYTHHDLNNQGDDNPYDRGDNFRKLKSI